MKLLPLSVSNVADRAACRITALAWRVGAAIALRSRIAGIGVGDGGRDPGTTHQQGRCEHANTCSEAQMRQNDDMPPSQGSATGPTFATFWHSPTIGCRALLVFPVPVIPDDYGAGGKHEAVTSVAG